MVKVTKLFGFYSLLIGLIPLCTYIFIFIVRDINKEGVLLFLGLFFLPYLSAALSIVGLIKDKNKIFAIISLILSVFMILFFLNFFLFRSSSGPLIKI